MRLFSLLSLFALACTPPDGATPDDPDAARVIEEGTPEASGVITFLNDAGTSVTLLDIDAALDARAAKNLVGHRNGTDGKYGTADDNPFDTVAEIDGVSQVGDATLRALLAYADAHGWIEADEPLYGVVEGVELTVSEAADALRVANGASFDVLDVDAGLDSRAAQGIVDTRPFGNIEDVALVPYVGATAINRLVDYGKAHPITILDDEGAQSALEIAMAGLWYTSESDYPLELFGVAPPGVAVTEANAKTVVASSYHYRLGTTPLADRAVEEVTLARVLDRYTVEQDWWEESHLEDAPKWRKLRAVFESQLSSPQAFRFGDLDESSGELSGDIDIIVFGVTSDGSLMGFRTVSIET